MERSFRSLLGLLALAMVGPWMGSVILAAAERSEKARPQGEQIDLFAAVQQGQVDVQFIPQDENRGRLLVTNKTDKPLSVKLPDSFVGVPVLAQVGNFPFGNLLGPRQQQQQQQQPANSMTDPMQSNSKTPQRVGGGSGTVGQGQNGRNGFFNVAPEATQQAKLETVCLDYGHPRPRPAMKYEIRPVAAVTDKEGVAELCELLGRREIGHQAAQLAAWHLSNDMSWKKLAGLRKKQAIGTIPSYTKDEIAAAKKAVEKAIALHKQRQAAAKLTLAGSAK